MAKGAWVSMEKKRKLSDKVIQQLLDMIQTQKTYKVGDKLPNEQELSLALGVSRTTLREAILYLVAQNVLEIRRGKGTYIAQGSDDPAGYRFDELKYTHLRLRDLLEMRAIVEPELAYYAAARATDAEMAQIFAIGQFIEEAGKDSTEIAEWDARFHIAIARAAHNEFGIRICEIVDAALTQAIDASHIRRAATGSGAPDHKMIMDYLRLRDGEGARQAMLLHMMHSMKDYKD